jgi:hypothetical protein
LRTGASLHQFDFSGGAHWHGKQRTLLSDSPLNRRRIGCETVGGEFQGSTSRRMIGIASDHA